MHRFLVAGALAIGLAVLPARAEEAPPPPESRLSRLLLLPEISAVGSGALSWNDYDIAARSPREGPWSDPRRVTPVFQELELGLQAVVDPYARADVFVAFSDEGASLEEAYLTALTLPAGLAARAGTLFSPFGRLNSQHPHSWEFVDRPLPLQRLLALEALGGAGLDVAWLAPLPWFTELHLAYQSVEPAPVVFEEELEGGPEARAGIARLVNFVDLTERLTLGAGLSGALLEDGEGFRDLAGADLYLKYRPGETKAYVSLQAEWLVRRLRDVPDAATDWGTYVQAVYQVDRRWGFGVEGAVSGAEQRWSGLASFAPTEFQRIRLQGGWSRLPGGGDGLEALLSLEFAISAHGAHPF